METTKDLRIVKTKKAIKEAFIELLLEKSYETITVSELTNRALINRNTFYLHYSDKDDLLDQLTSESINRFRKSMEVDIFEVRHSQNHQELLKDTVTHAFESIHQDIDFYRAVFHDDNIPYLYVKLHHAIRDHFLTITSDPNKLIYVEYLSSGILGIIRYWINHPNDFTAEELADKLSHIQQKSMRSILLDLV